MDIGTHKQTDHGGSLDGAGDLWPVLIARGTHADTT